MAWGNKSGRTVPLPRAWKMIRANVLRRDSYQCQWVREDSGLLCLAPATDVDHGDEGPEVHAHRNLKSLCSYHHKQKTAQQGGLANAAKSKPTKKPHPGIQYLDD